MKTTDYTGRTHVASDLLGLGSKTTLEAKHVLRRKKEMEHTKSGAQSSTIIPKRLSVKECQLSELDGTGIPTRRRTLPPRRRPHHSSLQRKIQIYMPSTKPVCESRAITSPSTGVKHPTKVFHAGGSTVLGASHLPVAITPRLQKTVRKYNINNAPKDNARAVSPVAGQHESEKIAVDHISSGTASAAMSSSTTTLRRHQITNLELLTAGEPVSKDLAKQDLVVRRRPLPSTLDSSHHLHFGTVVVGAMLQHTSSVISTVDKGMEPATRSKPSGLGHDLQSHAKDNLLSQKDAGSLGIDHVSGIPAKKARYLVSKDVSRSC